MDNNRTYIENSRVEDVQSKIGQASTQLPKNNILKIESNFISRTGNRNLLENFKSFVALNNAPTKASEVVLAFRAEQAKISRDNFKASRSDLSEGKNNLQKGGNELIVNLKKGKSLSVENIKLFERLNLKPTLVNLYNSFQTKNNKASVVSKKLNSELQTFDKRIKSVDKNINKAEKTLERANKNLLMAQNRPIDRIAGIKQKAPNSSQLKVSGRERSSDKIEDFKNQRFANSYNNEQLVLNKSKLAQSESFSSYLKEQKSNLESKRNTREKLTDYEKALVSDYGSKPNLFNAYNLLTPKSKILDTAISNIKKELNTRSSTERIYIKRIENYSKQITPIDIKDKKELTLDSPFEKYRHKSKLLPNDVKEIKEYRTEQQNTVLSSSGGVKKKAEYNVKKMDILLERTNSKNQKVKEVSQEKENSINR